MPDINENVIVIPASKKFDNNTLEKELEKRKAYYFDNKPTLYKKESTLLDEFYSDPSVLKDLDLLKSKYFNTANKQKMDEVLEEEYNNYFTFAIDFTNGYSPSFLYDIKVLITKFEDKNIHLVIFCDRKKLDDKINFLYTREEIELLGQLNQYLKIKNKEEIRFADAYDNIDSYENSFEKLWNFETVLSANNFIHQTVKEIREANLTPMESILKIHQKVASLFQFNYEQSGYIDLFDQGAQTILGPFTKQGYVVCSGFSSLVKGIVDELNITGLSCQFSTFKVIDRISSKITHHTQLLVKLEDDNYKVNGYYFEDVTSNAKDQYFKSGSGYSYCLYPAMDVLKLKKGVFILNENTDRNSQIHKSTTNNNSTTEQYRISKEKLSKILSPAISYDTFMTAIENMYKKTGMYDSSKVSRDMLTSTEIAKHNFYETATNCFVTKQDELSDNNKFYKLLNALKETPSNKKKYSKLKKDDDESTK